MAFLRGDFERPYNLILREIFPARSNKSPCYSLSEELGKLSFHVSGNLNDPFPFKPQIDNNGSY